jgi:alkylhydroperoxidase/carboxymuconolactone decarboxylase family protein YurZ
MHNEAGRKSRLPTGTACERSMIVGASQDEVVETLGMAIYVGAGPSAMYASHALEAFRQFAGEKARASAA